jgi:HK97 gp10 family phage protein
MAVDTVQVKGFDELAAKLRAIVPAMRKRVLRNALAAGARLVRDDARRNAPVLVNPSQVPYRTPGLVKRSIVVRTSKEARRRGDVGVFVNVRPAKGAKYSGGRQVRASQRGAKSKNDPFYWRFLEFGTNKMAARPFLKPAAGRLPQALTIFQQQVGNWFAKVNASGRVAP